MNRHSTVRAVLAATVLGAATPLAAEVTLINAFEAPPDRIDSVVASWEAARDFLSGEPGYIDTVLHRSLDPAARFSLVNVARWDSPAAFETAMARMKAAGVFVPVADVAMTPALYRVVHDDSPEATR